MSVRMIDSETSDNSRRALDDEPRQRHRAPGSGGPPPASAAHPSSTSAAARSVAPVDAEQRRIRALAKVEIAPGGLPELVGRGRHVQHVVGDLKRESDRLAEPAERARARPAARAAASPPEHDRAEISAPVFARWIRSSSPSASGRPSPSRSSSWPPIIPPAPDARMSSATIVAARARRQPERARRATRRAGRERHHREPGRRRHGAHRTRDAPSARPRRMSSSSMHGRSSWTSE